VRRQVMSQPVRRRGAPGPLELRRLHSAVFRMGRFVGLDSPALLGLSEVSTCRRLRRCNGADVERVVGDVAQIARRVMKLRSDGTPDGARDTEDSEH
jgi:hypothetical protein